MFYVIVALSKHACAGSSNRSSSRVNEFLRLKEFSYIENFNLKNANKLSIKSRM